MPNNIKKSFNGIGIIPTGTLASDTMGELEVNLTGGKLNYFDGSARSPVVTEASTASLTNKTLVSPTISLATLGVLDNTHNLSITGSNTSTADRTLIFNLNDASRTISLNGQLTVPTTAVVSGTNTGDQTITLTGDVTGSGTGSFAATLAATTNSTLTTISSLVSVGTITTGTWNATTIAINKGGTGQITKAAGFDALSPSTTKGDIIVYSTTNIRLPVGSDGQILTADSTQTSGLKWGSALTNPMTTAGDIIYENATPVPARLAIGTTGQVLTVSGGFPVWSNSSFTSPMTTLGDIIYENSTPAAARLAGNTTTTKQYLSQTGNGSISAVPVWSQPNFTEIAGTVTNAQLGSAIVDGSKVTNNINLPGNTVKENGKNVIVSNTNASASLAIIRATFNASGVLTSGEGVSCTSAGSGQYTSFVWSSAFADIPSVMIQVVDTAPVSVGVGISGISTGGISQIQLSDSTDHAFSIIAIGQRS